MDRVWKAAFLLFIQASLVICSQDLEISDHQLAHHPNVSIPDTFNISIYPDPSLDVIEWQDTLQVTINITCQGAPPGLYHLNVIPDDADVASIVDLEETAPLRCLSSAEDGEDSPVASYKAGIYGEFLGTTYLRVAVEMVDGDDGMGQPIQAEEIYKVC